MFTRLVQQLLFVFLLSWSTVVHGTAELTTATQVSEDGTTHTIHVSALEPEKFLKERLAGLPGPNRRIVEILQEYPRSGEHEYWWPRKGESSYDGSTTDVLVRGIPAMRGEEKRRTFCCGLTLEVALRVIDEQMPHSVTLSSATLALFKKLWFCEKLFSPGPTDALVAFGMGKPIKNFDDALPGDFVQLWRHNRSGHSVIFVDWARSTNGKIVGVYYWSTQPATNGIGFNLELFGGGGKMMDRRTFSIVRLLPPSKWKVPSEKELLLNQEPEHGTN